MTDLEDALRSTLRARADAADREPVLRPGLERRISRARRRTLLGSVVAATAGAVAVAIAVSLATASSPTRTSKPNVAVPPTHRGVPLTDTGLTPPGWAPVPYLGAQISVPASWFIESSYSSICGGGSVQGMVFLGERASTTPFPHEGCHRPPANVVQLLPARPGRQGSVLHVTISDGPSGESLAIRGYGVRIVARGPLAGRVVGTLTRSPRSVVLGPGPAFAVPRGWRWHEFGGIKFATPAAWTVQRYKSWGGCGYNVAAGNVWLNNATKLMIASCPGPNETAGGTAANPGIEVSTGRYGAAGWSTVPMVCRAASGARVCVLAVQNDNWGLLELLVRVPGQRWPALILLGLAGSGADARTIFDSIRAG
jgi:hypothetical protein